MNEIQPADCCATCTYDLRGLDPSGNCPECGSPITHTCVECGTDVRKCAPEGFCPRCGRAAFLVPPDEQLAGESAETMRAITRALNFLYGGMIGLIMLSIGALPTLLFWSNQPIASSATHPLLLNATIALAVIAAFSCLCIALGTWGIGIVPPWHSDHPALHLTLHRTACAATAAMFAAMWGVYLHVPDDFSVHIIYGLEVMFTLLVTTLSMLVLVRLRSVERRSGHYRLSRHRIFGHHILAIPAVLGFIVLIAAPILLYMNTPPALWSFAFLPIFLAIAPVGQTRQILRTLRAEQISRKAASSTPAKRSVFGCC